MSDDHVVTGIILMIGVMLGVLLSYLAVEDFLSPHMVRHCIQAAIKAQNPADTVQLLRMTNPDCREWLAVVQGKDTP